jgi:hypothetical protein
MEWSRLLHLANPRSQNAREVLTPRLLWTFPKLYNPLLNSFRD